MRVACWVTKATETHTVSIRIAFPREQWLHDRSLTFRRLRALYRTGVSLLSRERFLYV